MHSVISGEQSWRNIDLCTQAPIVIILPIVGGMGPYNTVSSFYSTLLATSTIQHFPAW